MRFDCVISDHFLQLQQRNFQRRTSSDATISDSIISRPKHLHSGKEPAEVQVSPPARRRNRGRPLSSFHCRAGVTSVFEVEATDGANLPAFPTLDLLESFLENSEDANMVLAFIRSKGGAFFYPNWTTGSDGLLACCFLHIIRLVKVL